MTNIDVIGIDEYQDDSLSKINGNDAALNAGKLEKSGDTMTGPLQFGGATNYGIKVNNLTTAQRSALGASAGIIIYNTDLAAFEAYQNGAWVFIGVPTMSTTTRNTLTPVNGMSIYNSTLSRVQIYTNGAWRDFVLPKFGGDGSDGALTISSGNQNIDLGGARFVVKNYSSISITGTGKVTGINPHPNGTFIIIKCSGNIDITSSSTPALDFSGCGADASTNGYNPFGADPVAGGNAGNGNGGSNAVGNAGGGGASGNNNGSDGGRPLGNGGLGAGGVSPGIKAPLSIEFYTKYSKLVTGAGGGRGGTATGTNQGVPGNGGRGGGAVAIECAGAWNFTTTNGISVAGKQGSNGNGGADPAGSSGGGGGGGGGSFEAWWNSLTANTGTVNSSGGIGGNYGGGGTYGGANGAPGGDGWSLLGKNNQYV